MSNITTDFIAATKKIHADVRAILTSLHLIANDVKTIREQTVSDSNKESTNTQTPNPDSKQTDRTSGGSKGLDMHKSGSDKNGSEQKTDPYFRTFVEQLKQHAREPRFIMEVLALLGLFFYSCETRRTNNLTQIAIGNAEENFIKDHAPSVWVTPQPPMLNLNENFRWDVQYANYGRSPALELHSCATAAYGPVGLSTLVTINLPDINGRECKPRWRSSTVLPPSPGFIGYTSAVGEKPLSQSDIDTIKSIDGGAVVLGIIEYSDATGHTYDTVFCSYRLQAGALMNCEKYNYIRQTK